MAGKILPVLKLATKVTIAGGALYVAYDSGLLGGSEQGSKVIGKAKAAFPPAVDEWVKYFGFEGEVSEHPAAGGDDAEAEKWSVPASGKILRSPSA
ncbi:MICOS complex subunit MIC13-like isoform X2 [Oncorhynchus kisutch]|uniref:MICOS complex subunit MIC13-like isoform X2 n=1 Tax=Oncorhynchus kisutch TaxID=8019 RepID=UPI0012DD8895|nr:MICOS complex subunit MIC13-like isoform X2 [Oncorhynchus kisutch]